MRRFVIGDVEITNNSKPYVVAELGNNSNGSVELCKTLISRAKANGAHAVKLQKRDPQSLFTAKLYNSEYNGPNSFGSTYGTHREALEFDQKSWEILINHAKSEDITLFSTSFDHNSTDFLSSLNMPMYKVASGCLRDIPLIKQIALLDKPMIISTGGAEWSDIDRVYTLLSDLGSMFCFLHCTMQYPTAAENVNLRIIEQMRLRYSNIVIGFSDHTIGTWAIPAAYGFGAQIFEKHFTSNKSLPGPDHALSIEPDELQYLVHNLDRIYAAKGSSEKRFLDCEKSGYYKMAKTICTARPLASGVTIKKEDVTIKSPAAGLEPYHLPDILGRPLAHDVDDDQPLIAADLEGYST